jgi:hypothetical protein
MMHQRLTGVSPTASDLGAAVKNAIVDAIHATVARAFLKLVSRATTPINSRSMFWVLIAPSRADGARNYWGA